MYVYKYFNFNRGLEVISNGLIYLSSPNDFNDPFDCDMKYRINDKFVALMLLYTFHENQGLIDIVLKRILKNAILIKIYRKIILYSLKKAEKNALKHWKFSSCILVYKSILRKINKNKELHRGFIQIKEDGSLKAKDAFSIFRNNCRIACFSEKNDDILMWAHYADSNKGICIKFEVEDKYFVKVKYELRRKKLNLYQIQRYLLAKSIMSHNFNDISKSLINLLFPLYTKSRNWKYEKEIRCISYNDTTNNNFIIKESNGTLLNFYKPIKIKCVYLGCDTSDDDIEIKNTIKDKNITIYKMKLSKNKYRVIPAII